MGIMRNNYLHIAIAFAATLFVGCAKEVIPTNDSNADTKEFVIYANSQVDTKTAFNDDCTSIMWSENDKINVFHAEAGTVDYINDTEYDSEKREERPFIISDAATGKFTGQLLGELESTKSYDWYAIYPFNRYISSPAVQDGGYVYLGSRSDRTQVQTGNDSKSHLVGGGYPLYGVAKSVSAGDSPSISMKQAASIIAVKVTNTTEDPLTVSSVSFTGTEDIVGTFFMDITGTSPVFTTEKSASSTATIYVSDTANLTVNDGTAIAKDESATFYLGVKPFTAESGKSIKVSVNGYEKTLDLTSNVSFAPGKIKTIKFDYNNTSKEQEYKQTFDYAYFSEGSRLSNKTDQNTYFQVPSGNEPSVAALEGIFSGKTIISDVTVTINSATYGSGTNPSASTFSLYTSSSCATSVPSVQSGNLPTSSTYTNVVYTISKDDAQAKLSDDLAIKITKPGKTIRFRSVEVSFKYTVDLNEKTIVSIVVSGAPTKTSYYSGEAFEVSGLVVTANYSDGSYTVLTDNIEWNCTPSVMSLGTNSVVVVATVDGISSSQYTVTNLTVREKETSSSTSISEYADGTYYIVDTYNNKYYAMSGSVNSSKAIGAIDISAAVTLNSDGSISIDATNPLITDNMKYSIKKLGDNYALLEPNGSSIKLQPKGNNLGLDTGIEWSGFVVSPDDSNRFSLTATGTNSKSNSTANCLLLQTSSWDSTNKVQKPTLIFKGYAQSNRGTVTDNAQCYASGYMYFVNAN